MSHEVSNNFRDIIHVYYSMLRHQLGQLNICGVEVVNVSAHNIQN